MANSPSDAAPAALDALGNLAREAVRVSDLAREALRVSESRYRRLFETALDGILLINADTAQIEDVNPFLIRLLDYTHEEFLGKKLWEVGPFKDIAQSKEMFLEIQTKGYVRYEDLHVAMEHESNQTVCDFVQLALFTGARRSNVMAMQWPDVHMERPEWHIAMTKNGDPQTELLTSGAI
jgi:PAS domain S-box-containing protein